MAKRHGRLDQYKLLGVSLVDNPLPGMEFVFDKDGNITTKNLVEDLEVVDEDIINVKACE